MMDRINSLNLRYIKARKEDRKGFSDRYNYDQRNYQNMFRSDSRDRRISFSGRIQSGQNYRNRPMYEQNYRNDFRRGNIRGNLRKNQNYRGQN